MGLTPPIEPMLARSLDRLPAPGALPGGVVLEQKVDGYRAIAFVRRGRLFLQTRRGADLTPAFPDLADAVAEVGKDVVLDGELVVPRDGRLDFTALQDRARRRGSTAEAAAAANRAFLICFDVLEADDIELLAASYAERRARLEKLFADEVLAAPFVLCPATPDFDVATSWLDPAWGAAGIEGVVAKGRAQRYHPGERAWIKVRRRDTHEAIVGAVTGGRQRPTTVLLGRYDDRGRFHFIGRSVPLAKRLQSALAENLAVAPADHPWTGRNFSAGWGSNRRLDATLVEPDIVAEFSGDTAIDHGRWRHPVRLLRIRAELHPTHVPLFADEDDSAGRSGSQYER
ncbi:ATP-dependent DNA ligase [Streptomyces sp. NPDC047525]|uniref:ATP-dependent DNA ligase n=1 Tax=Streptomyces sp. NPDC047525 TaxID=3155264 RepID=UPI00340345D7